MSDLPVNELLKRADEAIGNGAVVFFKFTCEKCGARQTFDTPNTFFIGGRCEECGHVTIISEGGFMAMFKVSQ